MLSVIIKSIVFVQSLNHCSEDDTDLWLIMKTLLFYSLQLNLEPVQKVLGIDIYLAELSLEYEGSLQFNNINDICKVILSHLIHFHALSNIYRNVINLMANLEPKSHSPADEYFVTTNAMLKSTMRNQISVELKN